MIKILFNRMSMFFWEHYCAGCFNSLYNADILICDKCQKTLLYADEKRVIAEFDRKFRQREIITQFLPLYIFQAETPIQSLIHGLKYEGKTKTGIVLGRNIGNLLNRTQVQFDLLIPVPLHKLKKRERGYNQSEYLSRGISEVTGIKTDSTILKRIRYTESQTNKTLLQRRENMSGAFTVRTSSPIINKHIALIDDVITTGATIEEAAQVLLHSGAASVSAVSAALAD